MFSASSINKIYKKYDMYLIDAMPQKTHGGSMRYIITNNFKVKQSNRLIKILKKEKRENVDNLKGCISFKKRVENSKKN